MLFAIKLIHSIIWLVFVALILFILWSGITGNVNFYSWLAVLAILGEVVVLSIFKGQCPLTITARKYSHSTKSNFDIFLPEWLAKHNKQIFGALFCLGLVMILVRSLSS